MYSLSNIVFLIEYCIPYRILYSLWNIVFLTEYCIPYKALYSLQNIVFLIEYCIPYRILYSLKLNWFPIWSMKYLHFGYGAAKGIFYWCWRWNIIAKQLSSTEVSNEILPKLPVVINVEPNNGLFWYVSQPYSYIFVFCQDFLIR